MQFRIAGLLLLGAMMGLFLDYATGVLHDIAPHA